MQVVHYKALVVPVEVHEALRAEMILLIHFALYYYLKRIILV